jgi:hypothetical protein
LPLKSWQLRRAAAKENGMAHFLASRIQAALLNLGVLFNPAVGAWR